MNMQKTFQATNRPLILSLTAIDASLLPLVGGKAANLGELMQAGLPVPDGFCITTTVYELATQQAGLEALLHELATMQAGDTARLEQYAAVVRAALLAVTVPTTIVEAIREAYHEPQPVAVRSSATAEDLPFASFAGQQETYLNVIGIEALLDAVRRCWASLWTDRAVSYRTSNHIDARTVSLAVVVQQMVNAAVAGVLFTANPLTGRRHQAVIDANPGLGEAVVSGAVNPDHFVLSPPIRPDNSTLRSQAGRKENAASFEVVERRLGEKRLLIRTLSGGGTERIESAEQSKISSLTDEQLVALAKLGMQVEAHFGAPQDTEWAIDDSGKIWLTQARPITTLFPLPADAPPPEKAIRVYFSVNVAQGVYGPLTPMGIAVIRLLVASGVTLAGFPPPDPLAGPAFVKEAADRLFMDLTPMLRSTFWRPLLIQVMGHLEARSVVVLQRLASDPRFAPVHTSRLVIFRKGLGLLVRTKAAPVIYLVQALLNPKALRSRFAHLQEHLRTSLRNIPSDASTDQRLATLEHNLFEYFPAMLSDVLPLIWLVFGLPALAGRLLNGLAAPDELQAVRRSLPYNPTTEMDLELWQVARRLREKTEVVALFRERRPEQIAQAYREGTLPPALQQELAGFLRTYGHRGVAEIDLGVPRWSEDPTYLLGVLANYLPRDKSGGYGNPDAAPDVQFQRGAQDAEAMVLELTRRSLKRSWLRGRLVHFCLRRIRDLSGLREAPKYTIVLVLAEVRRFLLPIGEELRRADRLESAEDIFFITLSEAHQALAGKDMRALVRERRLSYERELGRRHIPRILLSDGTEPEAEAQTVAGATADGILKGTPASAGVVTATARVILDPVGARLEPGEILVAPSTDPGWTPLFLTASGLVMEMGGPMSHGAVVAREYGIPAVVGVSGAIERITTGQQITIDGSQGTVTVA
jgi:phosphohistidine swiveling domain-containing protein